MAEEANGPGRDGAVRPERVLITGSNGRIGRVLRTTLAGRYAALRLADITPLRQAGPGEELASIDLADPASLERAFDGIDCVIHLAGQAVEADWETILSRNIVGVHNVFEAARRQRVPRVIFTSSHHAVGFYRRTSMLDDMTPPRPDSRYGVSKAFGEAMGRFYADKYGMSVACIRIGVCRTRPEDVRHLSIWISEGDMTRLVRCCVEAPDFHFLMLYGISANRRSFCSNPDAQRIGYFPQDDSEAFAAELLARHRPEHPVSALFQGGYYCPPEFSGDAAKIA